MQRDAEVMEVVRLITQLQCHRPRTKVVQEAWRGRNNFRQRLCNVHQEKVDAYNVPVTVIYESVPTPGDSKRLTGVALSENVVNQAVCHAAAASLNEAFEDVGKYMKLTRPASLVSLQKL